MPPMSENQVISSVTVVRMSKNEMDPAANTQQFRAFAQGGGTEPAGPRISIGMIIIIVVALIVVAAAIAGIALA